MYEDGPRLTGLEGVVDKDLAAAILARDVEASVLLVLTVPGVIRDFGTERAEVIGQLTAEEARAMLDAGGLGEGSMGPKVRAAVEFVDSGGERAVIASLEQASEALAGEAGTTITA